MANLQASVPTIEHHERPEYLDRLAMLRDHRARFERLAPSDMSPAEAIDRGIVVEAIDEKLSLAARNLPNVEVLPAAALNPLALATHDKVLMTVGAVKLIEERLQ